MKPSALKVCVLIGMCASLAECTIRPREVAHRISTAIDKRQELKCSDERVIEIFQKFPPECVSVLADVENDECDKQCFKTVCNDSCAQLSHDFFDECLVDPLLLAWWELFCARNENGTFCYDAIGDQEIFEVDNACEDSMTAGSCSVSCKEEVEKSNNETGCCFYTLAVLDSNQQETDENWAACDVDAPGLCTSRFTGEPIRIPGSGATTVTGYVSVLVVTLLMASTSLN